MITAPSPKERPVSLAELIDFLDLSIECAGRACAGLRYDFYEPRDRFSVLLLYAVIDHGRAVLALARAATFFGIPVITRSALDAYTDIANLADHPHYWKYLIAIDAEKWKALLERASRGGNPALKGLSESELLPTGRRQYAQELKAMRAEGTESLGIEARFKKAGLTHEYESVYAILSDETHNNISGLQSRYIDYDEDRAWIAAQDTSSTKSHHYEFPCTLTMGELVLRSTEKVLRLFGHGVAVIADATRELERIWKMVQAEEQIASDC